MKKTALFIVVFYLFSCKPTKPFSENYQVQCVSTSTDASYKVEISFQSIEPNPNLELIKLNAIDAILFRGLTGGKDCITQKPMLTINKSEAKTNSFFKDLYGKKSAYNKYVSAAEKTNDQLLQEKNRLYNHVCIVSINKDLLRKDLITANLLKPLNAGF
jgi:hypothetical protein